MSSNKDKRPKKRPKSQPTKRVGEMAKVQQPPSLADVDLNHDTLVRDWEKNAKTHDDDNYEFLRSLKFIDHGLDVDQLANQLHQRAFQTVDCTQCANCCKHKKPKFDEADVERIASFLGLEQAEFIDRYLEPNPNDPPYQTREMPCPLLGDDNRCTVYEVRPTVCRGYPYTDQEGFLTRTMGISSHALECPAVFWIVEQMKQHVENGS